MRVHVRAEAHAMIAIVSVAYNWDAPKWERP
jgi:hypothetical protein